MNVPFSIAILTSPEGANWVRGSSSHGLLETSRHKSGRRAWSASSFRCLKRPRLKPRNQVILIVEKSELRCLNSWQFIKNWSFEVRDFYERYNISPAATGPYGGGSSYRKEGTHLHPRKWTSGTHNLQAKHALVQSPFVDPEKKT